MFSFFNKSKSQSQKNTQDTPNTAGNETADVKNSSQATNNELSNLEGTLFGKLFHKTEIYSGPETSYENEAWAPDAYVGLFRKKRATAEEQLPSSSDPQ